MSSHKLKPDTQFRPFGTAEDEEDNEKQKATPVICDENQLQKLQNKLLYLITALKLSVFYREQQTNFFHDLK